MFEQSKRVKQALIVGIITCAVLAAGASPGTGRASPLEATAPVLGTAGSFAVLAASTVTNTGATVINGNVGVSPGNAVTGFFPPGVVTGGTIHAGDATAAQARNGAAAAYTNLAGQRCDRSLTGQDLVGLTLSPGVYCFASSAQLTGTLTLNGEGNPNSVFVFQIGSTLTTASASSVVLINGAQSCNVFWQVGSSATLGTTTSFAGTILALTSITLNTNTTINGRALALNGAVTLDTNRVSLPVCAPAATATPTAAIKVLPTVTPIATTQTLPTATTPPVAATSTAIAVTSTAVAATSTAAAVATSTAITATSSVTPTASTGVPLAAHPVFSRLTVHRHRGIATVHWYSRATVRGFNVYNNSRRLNRHAVTSHTRWYHFVTSHAVNHLWIAAISRH